VAKLRERVLRLEQLLVLALDQLAHARRALDFLSYVETDRTIGVELEAQFDGCPEVRAVQDAEILANERRFDPAEDEVARWMRDWAVRGHGPLSLALHRWAAGTVTRSRALFEALREVVGPPDPHRAT
jgi:hypothetical protein